MSHFYPQHVANKLDGEVLRQVSAFNPARLLELEKQGKGFACGSGALASVMWAAQALGANHATILNYATSGDITGDYTQVLVMVPLFSTSSWRYLPVEINQVEKRILYGIYTWA